MRKYNLLVFLISLSIFFAGCPYSSTVPLDKPAIEVREELLGVWETPADDNNTAYIVGRYNKYVYKIEKALNDSLGKPERYFGHLSVIDSITFLNLVNVESFARETTIVNASGADKFYIESPDSVPRLFYFYKVEKKGGLISLTEVTPNITEKFESSGELREFFRRNMKNSYFFDKDEHTLINKYQIEKNEKAVIQLSKDKALQELQLEKTKTLTAIILAVLILVVAVSVLLWLNSYNKQKTHKLLLEKKQISAKLSGQEAERQRIATDLHDRLGSMLATVKLYFNSVEEGLESLKKENRDQYIKANSLLDEACDEVRKISHDLSPGVLIRFGIVAALNELKETITQTNKLKMNVIVSQLNERIDPETESTLFKIVQELTSNVIRHAKAENLTVWLKGTGTSINLKVEDDGIGIDLNSAVFSDGIGISTIRERVSRMNGKINISSDKKTGTIITIDIPV